MQHFKFNFIISLYFGQKYFIYNMTFLAIDSSETTPQSDTVE